MQEKRSAFEENSAAPFWRKIILSASIIGAIGSLTLMFNAGRQTPVFLLILFFGWVSAPFIVVWFGYGFFKPWSTRAHVLINSFMWLLTAASLICYSGALDYPGMKPAFMFVMVPPVSLLLVVIVGFVARRLSRRLR